MEPEINKNGDVVVEWVKQEFPSGKADLKQDIGSYKFLYSFGKTKVLAFKRPVYKNETFLPEQITRVIDPEELDRLERIDDNKPWEKLNGNI